MDQTLIQKITKSPNRKSFYHFTRVRNLPSIAQLDALYSSFEADPNLTSRSGRSEIQFHGQVFVANAHLRIASQVMEANTTQALFFHYLDQHVFFWPTPRHALKMLETYSKREPQEAFAILQLDAEALLQDFFEYVKFSKYDSGSSPRYPSRVSYKKSRDMFLPLHAFESAQSKDRPSKPSEIFEVLVERKVTSLSRYLQAVYCKHPADLPVGWRPFARPLQEFTRITTSK